MRFLRKKLFKKGLKRVALNFLGNLAKRKVPIVGNAISDTIKDEVERKRRQTNWLLIALAIIAIVTFIAVLVGYISPETAEKILKLF